MQDPFIGTWKLNPAKSEFDSNHRITTATMALQLTPEGHYRLTARGLTETGEKSEKPTTLIPDGQAYPVADFPGLVSVVAKPDPNTLVSEVRRDDGSIAGGGSYVISPDGTTLTATTFGFDTQLRQFQQKTVWLRES